MKINNITRSNLFLIELIIVIMFFAFASVITIQVFIKADHIASETVALNRAIMVTQTAAELAKATELESLSKLDEYTYYDEAWNKSEKKHAVYTLHTKIKLDQRTAGTLATFTNIVTHKNETIYELECKKYYSTSRRLSQ